MRKAEAWKSYTILLALGAVITLLAPVPAPVACIAATVERLVMPGEVIKGHARYEDECSRCHRPFSKTSQKSLCLDCHEKIAADVKKGRGFHGLSKKARDTECRHCHTEHKGRDARVVLLDREVFDHKLTDFPLKGAHARVKCIACHKPKDKYRDAPAKCIKCHKEDEPHHGQLGKQCAECHVERTWSEIRKKGRFNHDKTDFPLKGEHKKISCNSCHPDERYKKTPKECYACHVLNDVHGGEYGKKCGDCHSSDDWKKYKFDHGKTDFPLNHRHEKVACIKCHEGKFYDKKVKKTCYGCQKNDDEHKGRYGKKCKNCHTPKDWKRSIFDHDKTDFVLKGRHKKVDCYGCHKGQAYDEKLETSCYGCHKLGDVHKGQEGKRCESCHNERGWLKKVFFDHDLTRFPLIGLHAIAPCEQCHVSPAYKDAPLDCMDCHSPDDKHKLGLGPKCGPCHNPNGWALWRFDHDSQTDFTLEGAHEGLECSTCHKKPAKKKIRMSKSCFSCHQEDDVHRGRFGLRCERCHVVKSFQEIRIEH